MKYNIKYSTKFKKRYKKLNSKEQQEARVIIKFCIKKSFIYIFLWSSEPNKIRLYKIILNLEWKI